MLIIDEAVNSVLFSDFAIDPSHRLIVREAKTLRWIPAPSNKRVIVATGLAVDLVHDCAIRTGIRDRRTEQPGRSGNSGVF
jgi:hypothetical protein